MSEHSNQGSVLPAPDSAIAKRRRNWREFKDRLAKHGVAFGGCLITLVSWGRY
jgi:phosphate transport system permease protein